jgi:hypothetical protein
MIVAIYLPVIEFGFPVSRHVARRNALMPGDRTQYTTGATGYILVLRRDKSTLSLLILSSEFKSTQVYFPV